MRRSGMRERGEHGTNSAEVDPRYADADSHGSQDHQHVLQDTYPRDCTDATDKDECRDKGDSDDHGWSAADAASAGHLDDDSQTGELQLQVRNDEDDSDDGDEGDEIFTSVPRSEEVRFGLQAVSSS